MKSNTVRLRIDRHTKRQFQELDKLPEWIDESSVQMLIQLINRGGILNIRYDEHGELVITPLGGRGNQDKKTDLLGLPKIDGDLHEICDELRDETRVDPRRETTYSKEAFGSEKVGLSSTIAPFGLSARRSTPHALDPITDAELIRRREIVESRYTGRDAKYPHKPNQRNKRTMKDVRDRKK